MLMEGFCGYHADAEDGEEQKPGQVCAAPVLQRSPFSLCPLKDTHARTHTHGESTAGPAGTPSLPLSHLPRPANSARLGSIPQLRVCLRPQRAEWGRSQAAVTRLFLFPAGANWIKRAAGSNPSSARSAARDRFPFHGHKINTHRRSAEGHT